MTKLDSLTPEQEKLMVEIRDEYLDKFFTYRPIPQAECTTFIENLYVNSGLEKPEVVYGDSPVHIQRLANEMKNGVGGKKEFFEFSYYANCTDLGWLAFYDFFTRIGVINDEKFNEYLKFANLYVYDMIQLRGVCFVSSLPIYVHRKENVMHSEDSPAIEFKDGYKLYFWNGVNVPEQLIMHPETITQKDIMGLGNAEIRRCYMEKLGAKAYYNLQSGGKGLKEVDSCIDQQGNPMTLWETTIKDTEIDKVVQFLECTCPSTKRVYNIYPPKKAKTAWEAKYGTFPMDKGDKMWARQGDIGIVKIGASPEFPTIET